MSTDSLGFLDAVEGLPEQLVAAHAAAATAIDPASLPAADDVRNIAVLGMGGSGIAGDVLAAVANNALPVPVTVLKQYRTPKFVGPGTLVFALSYSGDTEETLSMTEGALDAGARVVAVSNGGALAELVAARGGLTVDCPPGYMPRAALGALVAPLFVTLFRMGLLPDAHSLLVGAQDQLVRRRDKCAPAVTGAANPAREIARRLDRTIALIYGGGALGAVAAMRWKADINENAKAPAFWNTHPELDHNEICGWGQYGDVTRQVISLVELRHGFEHARLEPRFAGVREQVEECVHQVIEVRSEGEGRLAHLLDLMYLGDWVSCYLALQNDVDPGPIPAIALLKARLDGAER
ncbi:MAG: bifunctional phosphoglucose/phosphomannose isomerase [Acidimicrobiia bacterium]